MKVEYTKRAVFDLKKSAADSHGFGTNVTRALGAWIEAEIQQLAAFPESAPKVEQRTGVRMQPFVRYPYKVFYRVFPDRIRILHIRHTSRKPWAGDR